MSEHDRGADVQQPGFLQLIGGMARDASQIRRPPKQRWVAQGSAAAINKSVPASASSASTRL
jgi:hypothetical protein